MGGPWKRMEIKCRSCGDSFKQTASQLRYEWRHECKRCRFHKYHATGLKHEWHNVKPTPPGTVKMLVQMSDEIDRYLESKGRS